MHRREQNIYCPYCGEPLTLLIDDSESGAEYIEDCQVCCQPMVVSVWTDEDGEPIASARREDE